MWDNICMKINIIKFNLGVFLFVNILFVFCVGNVFADLGPIDTNSQDIEHERESGHKNDDDDDDDYIDLTKSKYTPQNLTAVSTSNKVRLSWRDKAKQEKGYFVERKKQGSNWRLIAKIGKNSDSYFDSIVEPGTFYTYRVKAFNAHVETSWSNEISIKTKGISPEDKQQKEKEKALENQKTELKKEFEITLKKEIANTKKEVLSQVVNTCELSDVSIEKVEKAFRKRCEEMTGENISSDKSSKIEIIKNKIFYNSKNRFIFAGLILFIVLNNVLWHIRHTTVKNKLKGEI